jgi:hypothetical protein
VVWGRLPLTWRGRDLGRAAGRAGAADATAMRLLRFGEEGFEVVWDARVEGRLPRPAGPIDRRGR